MYSHTVKKGHNNTIKILNNAKPYRLVNFAENVNRINCKLGNGKGKTTLKGCQHVLQQGEGLL